MTYQGKRTRDKNKSSAIYIVIAVLLVLIIAAVFIMLNQSPKRNAGDLIEESTSTGESQADTEWGIIGTPFGDLILSEVWIDKLTSESKNVGTDYLVKIYSNLDDAHVELFSVRFGEMTERGFFLGTVTDKNGEVVNVSIEMDKLVDDDTWSEETYEELCGLQESVNDLIVQIQSFSDFISAND